MLFYGRYLIILAANVALRRRQGESDTGESPYECTRRAQRDIARLRRERWWIDELRRLRAAMTGAFL